MDLMKKFKKIRKQD